MHVEAPGRSVTYIILEPLLISVVSSGASQCLSGSFYVKLLNGYVVGFPVLLRPRKTVDILTLIDTVQFRSEKPANLLAGRV